MKNDPFHTSFDSLEEFADVVSSVLHCPITIEDANHRLLSYSTHDASTDPARISTIIGRRVPEKVINHLWKEGVIPTLLSSQEPVRIQATDDIGFTGGRVAVSIWKKDEVLGFIWALEVDNAFSENDLLLLKKAAESAKNILLHTQARKHKREERYQEFFWQLLTSHFHSNEQIITKFQMLQITPPDLYSIVVFQFPQEISREEEKKIDYLLKTVQQSKVLLQTIDQGQLILLLSVQENNSPLQKLDEFGEWFITKMEERYSITSIVQAISGLYYDYLKIEKAYQEAVSVLSLKKKFPDEVNNLHSYQTIGFYKYLDVLQEKTLKEGYENYSLKKLHEYDQKYHYNLVDTLEVYLNQDSNVHEAAKTLNIHTNTLNYRLKRIAEIGEIDLKNANQKMTLFLDLKIRKYM